MDQIPKTFLLRRLHSLTGIAMGGFLFNHFLTNSFIFQGREAFNHKVHFIHNIPYLLLVEIGLIFLPFLFHMVYGIYIMVNGSRPNSQHYRYGRNYLYTIQRMTAWILAGFIIWHLWELRFYVKMTVEAYSGGGHDGEFVLGAKFYDYLVMSFENPFFVAGYVLGVVAAIIHWCNGICTFCMTWGISVGKQSQRIIAGLAVGVGLLYAAMIGVSIYGLLVPPDAPQPIVEGSIEMYPKDEWRPADGEEVALFSGEIEVGAEGASPRAFLF